MTILWTPSTKAINHSQMIAFMQFINKTYPLNIENYKALHQWSIQHPEDFWSSIWDFFDIIATKKSESILINKNIMEKARWFEGAQLNFAQNLLRHRHHHPALIAINEQNELLKLHYDELFQQVSICASQLKTYGLQSSDRVVACLPNSLETVIAMLATASLGGIWSSCSPDFGTKALIDRFQQIQPKILFITNGHHYKGQSHDHSEKIKTLQLALPSLKHTIILPFLDTPRHKFNAKNTCYWHEMLQSAAPVAHKDFQFVSLPFNHPLYILYSSGTTGAPKCIIHGAGGTLLQHIKELRLHTDLSAKDTIFFHTTCGWMMWHWLVSSLTVGATIILYEGSPFFPNTHRLLDLIDQTKITVFGVGASIIEHFEKTQLNPKTSHSLKSLRTILTTGSPLYPKNFDFIYRSIKKDVCVSSISGGSDIISCFALGNPILPVYRGELQCLGLGMDVKIFDPRGNSLGVQQKGELVCTSPFPSMPLGFWNDPQGEKYHHAYFNQYPNVWRHGDYALRTKHDGLIILGRSDTTLNPGGIRIGTAEIYQQIEFFEEEIVDCMAVGQQWRQHERIILFVVMRPKKFLTPVLAEEIKNNLRNTLSPHHVPKKIIAVPALPRTLNGKLAEIAVKNIINHRPVTNQEALADPKSLNYFQNLPALTTD